MNTKENHGFTLVEIAIAMIVIGLLVGGVLKGQELIENSRINATIAQFKGIKAGIATFQDSYQGYPGDILRASARIPNCGVCLDGNNNGRIDAWTNWILWGGLNEADSFWAHLNAADLLGEELRNPMSIGRDWGLTMPGTSVGGGFLIGYTTTTPGRTGLLVGATGPNAFFSTTRIPLKESHYLTLRNDILWPAIRFFPDASHLTPDIAMRFDEKMDDGKPNSGAVLALGMTACVTNSSVAADYNTTSDSLSCALAMKID